MKIRRQTRVGCFSKPEAKRSFLSLPPKVGSASLATRPPHAFSEPETNMAIPFPHPVIFLPGIMGSALRDQYPIDPEAVWSPLKLIVKAYERITLHPSDTRYELIEPARVAADQVFGLVYSEFI